MREWHCKSIPAIDPTKAGDVSLVICEREQLTAEVDRLTDALVTIAGLRQDGDDWDHPDYDWRKQAHGMEAVARRALGWSPLQRMENQ